MKQLGEPDRSMITRLIDEHQAMILGICLAAIGRHETLVGRSDVAEDVVQDVYLEVCTNAQDILSASNPGAYLRTTAGHAASRSVKKHVRAPEPIGALA